jgi:hypothetical protein
MPVAKTAEVTFTSADRVRDVIHNFNADSFDSLHPAAGPRRSTPPERREIKKIRTSRPAGHSLPFSTWSLAKLADFLVAEGWPTTSATGAFGSCSERRVWATYTRAHGSGICSPPTTWPPRRLYRHIKPRKNRTRLLFCRYLRSLSRSTIHIAIVLGNYSPHLTTKKDTRVGDWAAANNVELAYTPTISSAEPHPSPVHRPALRRSGRHRPCQP